MHEATSAGGTTGMHGATSAGGATCTVPADVATSAENDHAWPTCTIATRADPGEVHIMERQALTQ